MGERENGYKKERITVYRAYCDTCDWQQDTYTSDDALFACTQHLIFWLNKGEHHHTDITISTT